MSERAPELPAPLDEPVLAMLQKDAAARPNSVGEAFRALEQAARRAGIEIPSGLPRLPRPSAPKAEDDAAPADHSTERPTGARRALAELEAQARRQSDADGASSMRRVALAVGVAALLVGIAALSLSLLRGSSSTPSPEASAAPSQAAATTPAPSTTPETPRESASGAAARTVELSVSGAPEGANVLLGDRNLGSASSRVLVPFGEEPVALTITAPDHEPKTIHLTPTASMAISVPLTKVQRPKQRAKKTSTDLENPF